MIVFRYLSREVLLTLSAVSAVLLVIIMSGRFIKYLAQAASGALDPGSLFLIMGFRLPGFMQLILPLGLFLGILLSYGRLYLESEMTVLSATGMSRQRLLAMTMAPAALVALIVAWLSLSLAPQGNNEFQLLLNKQDALTEFDTLEAGRFQSLSDGTRVTYTEELSNDRSLLSGVFITQKKLGEEAKDRSISVLLAEKGRQEVRPDGSRWLVLGCGLLVGGSVAVAGGIGFVGLMVPHLLRPLVAHRADRLLLPSALAGSALVLAADILVRLMPPGRQLQLGVLTALVGAPLFVRLVFKERGR